MAITYNIFNGTVGLIIGFILGYIIATGNNFRIKKYVENRLKEVK